jgi:hypothetical protein
MNFTLTDNRRFTEQQPPRLTPPVADDPFPRKWYRRATSFREANRVLMLRLVKKISWFV